MSAAITIRQITNLTDEDLAGASKALGAAFKDDLFTRVITADDFDFYPEFWGTTVIAGSLGGEVYVAETADKGIVGAAVWFGPGRELYDTPEQQEKALAPVMARFSPELQKWWGEEFLPLYDEVNTRNIGKGVKKANWHLQTLGVQPDSQRQGIARAFIDIIKKKAAEKGDLLCLEAESEFNLMIYGKLGFKTIGEPGTFKGLTGEFPLWTLTLETRVE